MNIYGTSSSEYIYGSDDNDIMYGGQGNDFMDGGLGDDRLSGEQGTDSIYGGYGNDKLIGGWDNDVLMDEWGDNKFYGGNGDDLLLGVGVLNGENGNDHIMTSFQGHTTEIGGRGADTFQSLLNSIPDQYIPGTEQTQVVIKDFHPITQGDRLQLQAHDPSDHWYGSQGFGQPGSMEVFNMFDSNHDNKLSKLDDHVNLTSDGKGVELHWWGSTLTVEHCTAISSDWIV